MFFFWCDRTKARMRATSAVVHPVDATGPACAAAAEEGVAGTQLTDLPAYIPTLARSRPRGRAAANALDVLSATANATPVEPLGSVTSTM